jgi:hypothetical protein
MTPDAIENTSAASVPYAPPPPLWRRKRARRLAITAAVLLPLAFVGWQWGPALYRHAQHLYWQRQCVQYVLPPGTVVYEEDPQRATVLLAENGSAYRPVRPDVASHDIRFSGPLVGFPNPHVVIRERPPALDQLLPSFDATDGIRWDGVVFMHQRRSPGGRERLVIVPLFMGGAYSDGHILINQVAVVSLASPRSLTRAVLVNDPRSDSRPTHETVCAMRACCRTVDTAGKVSNQFVPSLRIFAGQPDPSDASHFTIEYEVREVKNHPLCSELAKNDVLWERGVLHGWLRDDDTVDFRVSGPLAKHFPEMAMPNQE